jgi:hypothetical protein
MKNELSKQDLYEGVKQLIETEDAHIHLPQHKLFTLFSVAFQYFLFCSTKKAGAYIIRVQDSHLAEKLARKAKDPSSRKFIQSMLLPRKLKYGKSTFFIDFFHIGSWNLTNEIPQGKIQGALIVKNTSSKPMEEHSLTEEGEEDIMANLPKDYYLSSLIENSPKTITIAFEESFDSLKEIEFPFIVKDKEQTISGVTLGKNLDWDNIDQ